ncbi:YcxB family protein [Agarivorans sp. MS3-6]|uniref:YcxB family protein n=1 Tax=Agarivorans sp. TSD2052 TaxID=2937286 RepID=UPI00200CB350|nr:YcxB family protein [Agarivorans sp. TSD2052]UPW18997.1 YcxB family protein [Agarivorans sp. TSD2052]
MQAYNTQFTLSRAYLAECFDQSLPYGKNAKPNYLFPAVLFVGGVGLVFFTEQPKVLGNLLIAMSVLELVHIRFRRAWWLTRQMWGRSADSEVKLSIDAEGVKTQNPYTQTTLLWADVERVIDTELGLILVAKSGAQQYLSKSLFSPELISEILAYNKN